MGRQWYTGLTSTPAGDSILRTNTWTAISAINATEGRIFHTAVWTGSEMIVFGGDAGGNIALNTGGRYEPWHKILGLPRVRRMRPPDEANIPHSSMDGQRSDRLGRCTQRP